VVGGATGGTSAQGPPVPDRSRLRRLIEVTAFWAVWCAIGQALELGDSIAKQQTYLLIGVPLVVAFQLGIAKRELRELWVRAAPRVLLARLTIALAVALVVYPAITLIRAIADGDPLSAVLYTVGAVAGAGAAAYAFGLFRRDTWRYLALCVLFATGYSVLIQLLTDSDLFLSHQLTIRPDHDLEIIASSFFIYISAVFVFEEVAFRGALDTHLHRPGESHGFWTALYISVLWSMWHAPLFGWDEAANLLIGMVPMGIALSIYWRKSGNLGVSGTAHALGDSIRNALTGVP
jgi:membrane protease YdiL (CAAX protease family)